MADEKELGIIVTGDISDVQEKLSSLVSNIDSLTDKTVDVIANVNDSQVEALTSELTTLENNTIEIPVNDSSLDQLNLTASGAATALEEIPQAANDITSSINSINDTALENAAGAASDLDAALNSLDPAAINEAASAASALGSNIEEASKETSGLKDNMQGTTKESGALSGSMDGLSNALIMMSSGANDAVSKVTGLAEGFLGAEAAAALLQPELIGLIAVIGLVAAAFIEGVPAAGQFMDSWLRLGQAVGETNASIQDLQGNWTDAINTMKDETGRSAGLIRQHIITMGLAGIESKDLIIDAFNGISAAAFVTGNDISTIENAFRRIVSSGLLSQRQLQQFGITTDDIFKATGMTMDEVSAKFKTMDTEGRTALLNQILMSKFGTEANTAYKNSWSGVLDRMKAAWDYLMIAVGQILLPIVIPALNAVTFILNTSAGVWSYLGNIIKGVNGQFANTSEKLVFLVGIIPGLNLIWAPFAAVIGVIADNWGRLNQAINDFITSIKSGDWGNAAQIIVNQFKWVQDMIVQYFADIPKRIGEYASKFYDLAKDMMNWIISGLNSLTDWLDDQLTEMITSSMYNGGQGMEDGLSQWLDDNGWKIEEIISDFFLELVPKLIEVLVKVVLLIGAKLMQLTIKTLNDWLIGIKDFMLSLPDKFYKWGLDSFKRFTDAIIDSIPGLRAALDIVKRLFPQSPPQTGPLSEITGDKMYNWMSDIMAEGISATGNFNLNNIVVPAHTTANATTNRFGGNTINLTVSLAGANINSELDAEKAGTIAGKAFQKEIDHDALLNNVSVINYLR